MAGYCSVLYLIAVSKLFSVTSSQLFQCQHSSNQGGLVYTPNIPDFYFNHTNAANSRNSGDDEAYLTDAGQRSYIFTVPSKSHNCSGTVRSIQYCYKARNGDIGNVRNVADFLVLSQVGLEFTVEKRIIMQTRPQDSICTKTSRDKPPVCCDTITLSANNQHYNIPSASYAYGVRVINRNVRPLVFADSDREYRVVQYHVGNARTNRDSFTLAASNERNTSLMLLRFFIDTTTLRSTDAINRTETTAVHSSDGVTSSGGEVSSSIGIVGGAVLGAVTVVLLAASAIITCVVLLVRRKKQHMPRNDGSLGFENATYNEAVEGQCSTSPAAVENKYAGRGPQVALNRNCVDSQENYCEISYADLGATYEVPINSGTYNEDQESQEEEDIYQVPATDEDDLYTQLRDEFKIQHLVRSAVRLGEEIGSGQFGVVYKGVLQYNGGGEVSVAVKTLKEGSEEEDRVKFLQEAAIMGQFKHHNVITMYGMVTEGEPVLLVLELLTKGDLRSHLLHMRSDKEGGVDMDSHTLLSYCRQVAFGMAYLSNKAFVHRDLAARNILVSEDEICKIADFGMSRDLMDEGYYVSRGGMIPVKWTAPEALHYKKYSTASDVWSYGALMYEIWSVGHKPYENYENNKVIRLIDSGFRLPPPPGCPRALYTIMISCWHPEASARQLFTDITQQLSLPDTRLLKWSEEDKSVHPEAAKLGANLLCAQNLYQDLQKRYKTMK